MGSARVEQLAVRYKVNSGKNLANIIIQIRQNAQPATCIIGTRRHAVAINVGATGKGGAI